MQVLYCALEVSRLRIQFKIDSANLKDFSATLHSYRLSQYPISALYIYRTNYIPPPVPTQLQPHLKYLTQRIILSILTNGKYPIDTVFLRQLGCLWGWAWMGMDGQNGIYRFGVFVEYFHVLLLYRFGLNHSRFLSSFPVWVFRIGNIWFQDMGSGHAGSGYRFREVHKTGFLVRSSGYGF